MIAAFFSQQNLEFEHVKALTAGMFEVAQADGVHDREMALIREFYTACSGPADPRLEDVVSEGVDKGALTGLFGTDELKKMYLKSLILVSLADGAYGAEEDAVIKAHAEAMGLDSEAAERLKVATKEFLLGGLSHIRNVDALTEVAAGLGTV